jgi:hypothetical protein
MTMNLLTGDAAVIYFAEALNKVRGLSDTESRILQRAMTRGSGMFRRWTAQEDARLLKMHKARFKAVDMALRLNRTDRSVYQRLHELKKRERVR